MGYLVRSASHFYCTTLRSDIDDAIFVVPSETH